MTRLCGLNPEMDYGPVSWALRMSMGHPRVRGDVSAETTVTAWEALPADARAALLLLNAECHYSMASSTWNIDYDLHGERHRVVWSPYADMTIMETLAHILDYGYTPRFTQRRERS